VDAQAYLSERAALVERRLERAIPGPGVAPAALHTAMRHLLFPGGKRLRPALSFAAAEAVGAPTERALPIAAAVELVHTYSLIHDDLPCMDDDVERRGVPTVHVLFGEAVAILAGDALLAAAFETLAAGGPGLAPERLVEATRELAAAAGSQALVGGQADDLAFAGGDAAAIESIHRRKSAALITAAVVGGALLGGADPATIADLRAFGLDLGLAFQIADDVLDSEGGDGPCSLVRALGPERAGARAEQLLAGAIARTERLGDRAEPLRELARLAVRRSR
jgi:geranylgeranyl diphosphate synthase type II